MYIREINREHIFGTGVIVLVTIFISLFSYINEPIGDDVLCYFDGALTYYLDEYPDDIGNRFTGISQVFTFLQFTYINWSGRMPGYFMQGIGHISPKYVQAFFTSIIFSSNIFFTLRIIYGNSKEVLRHPASFLVLFMALYWYRAGCFYEYMLTMVSIYSFAILLVLLYYNYYSYSMSNDTGRNIIVMQLMGFLAGFSHEVISLCLVIAIIVGWLKSILYENGKKGSIVNHFGLILGYLFCVLAPGNFHRMLQSHDVITNSYIDRLVTCIMQHGGILIRAEGWKCFFIVGLIAMFVAIKDKEHVKKVLFDKMDLIVPALLSIFIWAKSPRCPLYGLDLWIIIVYIVLLGIANKISDYVSRPYIKSSVVAAGVIVLFSCFNAKEIYSYSNTSLERRNLVSEAVEHNRSEVIVPRFNEELSNRRYSIPSLNSQEQYDKDFYRAFYGTRLVIDEGKK